MVDDISQRIIKDQIVNSGSDFELSCKVVILYNTTITLSLRSAACTIMIIEKTVVDSMTNWGVNRRGFRRSDILFFGAC